MCRLQVAVRRAIWSKLSKPIRKPSRSPLRINLEKRLSGKWCRWLCQASTRSGVTISKAQVGRWGRTAGELASSFSKSSMYTYSPLTTLQRCRLSSGSLSPAVEQATSVCSRGWWSSVPALMWKLRYPPPLSSGQSLDG